MSTKIYDAYKYHGSLHDIVNVFSGMVERYISDGYLKTKILRNYSPFTEINYKYGELTIKYLKDIDSIWCLSEFTENSREGKEFRDDITMFVNVFHHKSGTYVIFYNTPEELIDDKLFTDFHYQDQCDMSNYNEDVEKWESMSPERQKELDDDWDNRRVIWDEVFGTFWSSNKAGLSYDMSLFGDMETKRQIFHIFHNSLNNPILLRKIKIRRLRYLTKHKKNIDEIVSNGGSVHEVSEYCIKKGIKMSELYE